MKEYVFYQAWKLRDCEAKTDMAGRFAYLGLAGVEEKYFLTREERIGVLEKVCACLKRLDEQ